jgi:hypothetical protein
MTHPAPASTAPRLIAMLLIVHGVIGLGFIVNVFLNFSQDVIVSNPQFLVRGILFPAIIDITGIAAGVLILQKSVIARSLGRAICVIALVYQVLSFGYGIFIAMTNAGVALPLTFWLLNPLAIALYVAGLVVLSRWQPPPRENS